MIEVVAFVGNPPELKTVTGCERKYHKTYATDEKRWNRVATQRHVELQPHLIASSVIAALSDVCQNISI